MPGSNDITYRVGAFALGGLVGLPVGFVMGFVAQVTTALPSVGMATWVFGTAIALAVTCSLYPELAFAALSAASHFGHGALTAMRDDKDFIHAGQHPDLSRGERSFFYAGAIFVFVLAVVLAFAH